jgi:hypothetical protein
MFHVTVNDYFSDVDVNDAFLEDVSVESNGDVTAYVSADSLYLGSLNFVGFDTLVVSVADDSGAVATDTFVVEVINQNTPPYVVQAIPDTSLHRDARDIFYRELNKVFADLDANDVPLDSFRVATSGLVSAELRGDSLYLHANNIQGMDTIRVTAVDDSNAAASDTFVVNVNETTALEDFVTPLTFRLQQNYPNPFNPVTTIQYSIPAHAEVEIAVYNTTGQKLETLVSRSHVPGTYQVVWDGSGYASGVYLYQIRADGFIMSRKMLLIK